MPIINAQISQSSDDGYEVALGSVNIAGAAITATNSNEWLAMRFQVTLPQIVNIDTANLTLGIIGTSADDLEFDIYAQDIDDAPTLTTASNSISSRTRTTAVVNWSQASAGAGLVSSPDISAVIQEIADRPGRAAGFDLMLILDGLTGVNLSATSFDGTPALAASLAIEYTVLSFYEINGTIAFHGVQAAWERVRKRQNNDGTISYQPYALHTWDIAQMDATTFEALQALEGRVLTSLRTTDIDDLNSARTYTNAEIIGVVNGQQIGRRLTGVRVTFRVDVS